MPRVAFTKDAKPQIGVYSAGKRGGKATSGQFEFDVSTFRDPAGQSQFKGKDGTDLAVREWIKKDSKIQALVNDCLILADDMIKPKKHEGSSTPSAASAWLSFIFRDHNGVWTAPAIGEIVTDALIAKGYTVAVYHSDLNK